MSEPEIAQLVDRLMRRIHMGLQHRAPPVDTHKVGPQGGMLLMMLAELEPMPQHEIVRKMARDKSQITRAVASLEAKGLLTRAPSPHDGRAIEIRLTEAGHQTVSDLRAVLAGVIDDILEPLEQAEKTQLRDMLNRISP